MTSYKLYTDKPTIFECKIQLEGASLSNAVARLVLEAPNRSLLFEGEISKGGKCSIPIEKLRGIWGEDVKGKMKLEVIVDDSYFQPWTQSFIVTASKRLRVEVAEPKPQKTQIKVSVVNPEERKRKALAEQITRSLKKKGITAKNVTRSVKNKKYVTNFIKEAVERCDGGIDGNKLLTNVIHNLSNSGAR